MREPLAPNPKMLLYWDGKQVIRTPQGTFHFSVRQENVKNAWKGFVSLDQHEALKLCMSLLKQVDMMTD